MHTGQSNASQFRAKEYTHTTTHIAAIRCETESVADTELGVHTIVNTDRYCHHSITLRSESVGYRHIGTEYASGARSSHGLER